MADVKLTAQDIARELMVDARRVMVEEDSAGVRVRVARDSNQRWYKWGLPIQAEALASGTLANMLKWVKS